MSESNKDQNYTVSVELCLSDRTNSFVADEKVGKFLSDIITRKLPEVVSPEEASSMASFALECMVDALALGVQIGTSDSVMSTRIMGLELGIDLESLCKP